MCFIYRMNMEGGKKLSKKRGGDKDKNGGAVELGSVLAPAVLLGLQQLVKDGAKDKRRVKRGGANEAMFRSVPAPLEVAPLVPAPVAVLSAGKPEVPLSAEQVVVPQEASAVPTDSGSKPMEGGAKSPCSGGKKDKKAKKDGGKKKDDDKKDGGKKKDDDKKDGGKKKDDDKKDGGKKKANKGPSAEGAFGVSGKLGPAAASMNVKGKAKLWGGKDEKYGGALALYAEQLENITRQLDSLIRDD